MSPSSPKDAFSSLSIDIQKKEDCRIELIIKAPKEYVAKARKTAIKAVSKEVSLPGFRKGKAPEDLIIKKYPAALEEEWKKALADECFIAAQKQTKIPSLNPQTSIHYNIKSYSLDEGTELTFQYETEPEVPSVDASLFQLEPITEPEVGQKQIDEAIRQTQFFYAQWNEVDRPIQEGDYVILDLESIESEPAQMVFSKTRFEVSAKGMAKWMKDLLLGVKPHAVVEGISSADDTASEQEKKEFEPKKVRITIQKIEEATLPDLNDDFAKRMGLQTVQELENWIKEHLKKQADEKVAKEKHHQVCRFLIQNAPFALPASLVSTERNYRLRSALENPRFKQRWEKMDKKEREEVEKNISDEAIEAIKLFYISRKVLDDAKINISHDDVVQEASLLFHEKHGRSGSPQEIEKDLYALAFSRLVLAKAEEYILSQGSQEQKA